MAIGSHLIDTIESRLYTCPNSKVSIEGTEVEIPNNAPGPIEDQIITQQIRMHYRDWGRPSLGPARAPSSTCWRCTVSGHHAIVRHPRPSPAKRIPFCSTRPARPRSDRSATRRLRLANACYRRQRPHRLATYPPSGGYGPFLGFQRRPGYGSHISR